MADVLACGEHTGGEVASITADLVAAGRAIGGEVAVALLGDDLSGLAAQAASMGAHRVYTVEHPLLAGESADMIVSALEQVCAQVRPRVLLVGKTAIGRDVGPRLAFRLGAGAAQDSVAVEGEDSGRVVATRPVYGGSAMARVTFGSGDPQVVMMRPGAVEPAAGGGGPAEVEAIEVELDESLRRVRHVEMVREESGRMPLDSASVVVSGGRGLGGPEPFEMVEELAGLLGGAVGASRAACDAGWVDHSYQVGLTGATIRPDLYVTVGISGASQHMAGCSSSKHIVAINKDADANIFKEASFGVVGDWSKVLPSFMEAVRDLVRS